MSGPVVSDMEISALYNVDNVVSITIMIAYLQTLQQEKGKGRERGRGRVETGEGERERDRGEEERGGGIDERDSCKNAIVIKIYAKSPLLSFPPPPLPL